MTIRRLLAALAAVFLASFALTLVAAPAAADANATPTYEVKLDLGSSALNADGTPTSAVLAEFGLSDPEQRSYEYLDTSALVKLVRREAESGALQEYLEARTAATRLTSVVTEIELHRALRPTEPDLLSAIPAVLDRLYRYEITTTVRAAAAAFTDPQLRSLDAIHLATATAVVGAELTAFVTYSRRLLAAAQQQGLVTAAPGA